MPTDTRMIRVVIDLCKRQNLNTTSDNMNIKHCIKEIKSIQEEHAILETTRIIEEMYPIMRDEISNMILNAAQRKEVLVTYIFDKPYYVPYELRLKLEKHFKREGFVVDIYRKRVYDSVDEKTGKLVCDTSKINEKNAGRFGYYGGMAVLSMEVSWR